MTDDLILGVQLPEENNDREQKPADVYPKQEQEQAPVSPPVMGEEIDILSLLALRTAERRRADTYLSDWIRRFAKS